MKITVHSIIPITTVNGPGKRFGIWLQGCNRNCPGCFNPETHDPDAGETMPVAKLFDRVRGRNDIEGISISGGEPFLQHTALLELFRMVREQTLLSILVYSGFTFEEIVAHDRYKTLLPYIDILIAGPYDRTRKCNVPLLSSTNQSIRLLSDRYSFDDLDSNDVEIFIAQDGSVTITGHDEFEV